MSTIQELEDIAKDFEEKHGIEVLLKINLIAINKMLIKRGRGEELLENFKTTIKKFEDKLKDSGE